MATTDPKTGETTVDELVVTAEKAKHGTETFRPQISVVLKKNVKRDIVASDVNTSDRYKEAGKIIDLTAYLGQGASVQWSRSTRGGAGTFSVVLGDQLVPAQEESLYGLIDAMDVIEIRCARDISKTEDGVEKKMPIQMRGFVSDVRRETVMGSAGPERRVIITGHDYGKILEIIRVVYLPTMAVAQDLLTQFKLFLKYPAMGQTWDSPTGFMETILDGIVNPFLEKMRGANNGASSPLMDIKLDSTVTEGEVSPMGVNEWNGGTMWDLMRTFGDVGPFNELYIEDREDGPYLVYRPNPFKTAAGDYIQDGAEAETMSASDHELVAYSINRTDANVANYYVVDAPHFSLVQHTTVQAYYNGSDAEPKFFVEGYQNNLPETYGIRVMQVQSEQGARLDGMPKDQLNQGKEIATADIARKRKIIIEQNKDNVVLENGSLTLRGDEKFRAGKYLLLTRGGGFKAEHYAHSVAHVFAVGVNYVTTVEFDRGTGYIERLQKGRGQNSAYYTELSLRGAYGR